MTERHLHIISFDIPYPPAYGGVIDVYYKMKALAEAGVNITLHAYFKGNRRVSKELKEICRDIYLYPRKMDKLKAMGTTPFIIASRDDEALVRRLEQDDHPILMEGMHTLSIIAHPAFRNRLKVLRMHNIEWDYYRELSRQESSWWKRWFMRIESSRLKSAMKNLDKASYILAISEYERMKLNEEFPHSDYLPPFHGHDHVKSLAGMGQYALYHGNLAVAENRKAAEYLAGEVFSDLEMPLKIAGSGASKDWLRSLETLNKNLEVITGPDDRSLTTLIREAHINVLASFQATGVKLKLINALFLGRHCIVNPPMICESSLSSVCHVAEGAAEYKHLVNQLSGEAFTEEEIALRRKVLYEEFDDRMNAARLIGWLYPDH